MTNSVLRHERRVLALQLIERGLRTMPVRQLTGLPEGEIRALYRSVHGKSPPTGDVPGTAALFPNRRGQLRVSLLAALYRRFGGAGIFQKIDTQALIQSHDLYTEWVEPQLPEMQPKLSFTAAWVLARDLQAGRAWLNFCRSCQVRYLNAEQSDLPPTCPFCVLRKERQRSRKRQSDLPTLLSTWLPRVASPPDRCHEDPHLRQNATEFPTQSEDSL